MKQFIAHTDEPKTFAHKKGATAAIKRDLNKHHDAYGDVLYDTGFDVKPTGDRFGVVVYVDLTPTQAQELVGPELSGYVIEPQLKEDDPKVNAKTDEPSDTKTDEPSTPKRVKGRVEIEPSGLNLVPARHGSKQQQIIEMLARPEGASIDEMVADLARRDGSNWKPQSLMAGLYHHFPHKGYGITTTEGDNGEYRYHLVYPEGVTTFAAPRRPQSQQTKIDRMRGFLASHETDGAKKVGELTDDALLEKFKNVTALKDYVERMDDI
ncbi:hypothetical protein FDH38_gp081 [Dinoroseobacter phage vB_DshS-R5C]|uniref:Uncharacterized protein n=1 Tax=Dinoroseobacter phage vB_DshS-R5C TaxID=1965368 RepID=A0A1V0DYA8_9CAUD|nr:hypothetical protein FDH38_gp081 [Dinoroseobacter phage vB_DshS-R5C]ARB06135.1 hypothetical protein vBDshSR5C_81 [Dinoroseobacter phage vB_DshS-R5C]